MRMWWRAGDASRVGSIKCGQMREHLACDPESMIPTVYVEIEKIR